MHGTKVRTVDRPVSVWRIQANSGLLCRSGSEYATFALRVLQQSFLG